MIWTTINDNDWWKLPWSLYMSYFVCSVLTTNSLNDWWSLPEGNIDTKVWCRAQNETEFIACAFCGNKRNLSLIEEIFESSTHDGEQRRWIIPIQNEITLSEIIIRIWKYVSAAHLMESRRMSWVLQRVCFSKSTTLLPLSNYIHSGYDWHVRLLSIRYRTIHGLDKSADSYLI